MTIGWSRVTLGEILTKSDEWITPDPKETYREVTVKLWGKGVILRREVTGAEIMSTRRKRIRAGQLILSRIDARNGALGVVPDSLDGAVVSNDFPVYTINPKFALVPFLGWFIKTRNFSNLCLQSSEGTTNRVRLQDERFLSFEIRLPAIPEQHRIVARVETLASRINEARHLRDHVAEQSEVLTAARISEFFNKDSCWKNIQDAVSRRKGSVRSGPFGSQLLHEEFTDSGIRAIGTRDVQANRFQQQGGWFVTPEKFEQFRRYQVFPGDVLCTIVGASIGRFCVVPDDIPLAFTTKHIQALTLDRTTAEPRFVSTMLNFHRRCRESIFSQVEGSAQPSLNAQKILATALPLPSLSEQRRVLADLELFHTQVDKLTSLQAETAAELDALLPAILDRAFNGDL